MPRGSALNRLALPIAALTATVCLSVVAPAVAGRYTVAACNDAPAGRADGWTQARTAPDGQFDFASVCPSGTPDPYGTLGNGLAVADTVNAREDGAPDGSFAEWRFTAPDGTAIVEASVTRDMGNRDEWTPYARIDEADQVGESCVPAMGQSFCRIQGRRTFAALNARTLAYGIRCVTAPYCAHGATLRTVWVLVLGATVTLDDREAPTVSAVERVGLADGRWWNRGGGVSFVGEDNTGVRRRAVVVDGVVRAVFDAPGPGAGGCRDVGVGEAYSFVRPCADGRGLNGSRSVSVNPCSWGDGTHSVRGRVTDTGGLEAVSSVGVTVRVDCSAPALAVDRPGAGVVAGQVVEPVVVASDAASGLSATEVQVRVDDGAWQEHGAPVAAAAGHVYAFRARAVDVAGNWTEWAESGPILGVPPPPPPGPPVPPVPGEPGGEEAPTVERPPAVPESAGVAPAAPTAMAFGTELPPLAPAAPRRLQPAALRITRVLTRANRTAEIAGTAAAALDTSANLTVRAGGRVHTRNVLIRDGRWRARIRRAARPGARIHGVTLTTQATSTHAAGRARWRRPLAQHPEQ